MTPIYRLAAALAITLLLFACRNAFASAAVKLAEKPEDAELVTGDVERFWQAYDTAQHSAKPGKVFDSLYFKRGSAGLHDFVGEKLIGDGNSLWSTIQKHSAYYAALKKETSRLNTQTARIREAFVKFKAIYPEAAFPATYFLIGQFQSGGTATEHGLLIGTEIWAKPADGIGEDKFPPKFYKVMQNIDALPHVVAHELVHFQQPEEPDAAHQTLLWQAIHEGSADFIAEMISGKHINAAAHAYGAAHEEELWTKFAPDIASTDMGDWFFKDPGDERPNDLGYFIGYRIVQSYYAHATHKHAALVRLLTQTNTQQQCVDFLRDSGYGANVALNGPAI